MTPRERSWKYQGLVGATEIEYERRRIQQGGRCAICRQKPLPGARPLQWDHDKKTGKPRGLLCWVDNRFLLGPERYGLFRMRAAVAYLEAWES